MTRVKKELKYLKEKAQEVAGKLINDQAVTNLQAQIQWFKNEADKLNKILESQKVEFQKLKSKQKNVKDDNVYLKDQVKDAMRNNRLLEVALNKANSQTSALAEFLRRNKIDEDADHQPDNLFPTAINSDPVDIINKNFHNDQIIPEEKEKNDMTHYDIENYKESLDHDETAVDIEEMGQQEHD